jgi:hypothetical protein
MNLIEVKILSPAGIVVGRSECLDGELPCRILKGCGSGSNRNQIAQNLLPDITGT